MLNLLDTAAAAQPPHWQIAPMPQAAACLVEASVLIDPSTGERTPLSAPLVRALAAANADATLATIDAAGEFWRLRRTTMPQVWLLQSLSLSRLRLTEQLRSGFAARLAHSVLHELRNPLNALTLQCDLLDRTWKTAADGGGPTARLAQMKDHLKDLNERQNAVGLLWLASPREPAPARPLDQVIEETLRLLRNHCAQRELRLAADDLSGLTSFKSGPGTVTLQLALIAAVVWAGDAVAAAGATQTCAELRIQTSIDERGRAVLRLPAPLAASDPQGTGSRATARRHSRPPAGGICDRNRQPARRRRAIHF